MHNFSWDVVEALLIELDVSFKPWYSEDHESLRRRGRQIKELEEMVILIVRLFSGVWDVRTGFKGGTSSYILYLPGTPTA